MKFNHTYNYMQALSKVVRALLASTVVSIAVLSCNVGENDGSNERLDSLEKDQIPSLAAQVQQISSSIASLTETDRELKGYISTLQTTTAEFQKSLNTTNERLDKAIADLSSDISEAKREVLAQLLQVREDMQGRINGIGAIIEELKGKDTSLEERIEDLQAYIDTHDDAVKDWASGTFVTLEQYNSTAEEVAGIKGTIIALNGSMAELETRIEVKIAADISDAVDAVTAEYTAAVSAARTDITTAYTTAIAGAISASEESMKTWVSEQLTGYYTVAEADAKLAALETLIGENAEEIGKLRTDLEGIKSEITSAYTEAISIAIGESEGRINETIATKISEVNGLIDKKIAAIEAKIGFLTGRVDALEGQYEQLIGMVQSMVLLPSYSDGSLACSPGDNVFAFEVTPSGLAASLAGAGPSIFSMKAFYVGTKSYEDIFITLPVSKVETDGDILLVTASGANLGDAFFSGMQAAVANLNVSYGLSSYSTAYFQLYGIPLDDSFAVDLGLSVQWATCNLGANVPEEYGDYYAWGEIEPKAEYSWANYKWGTSESDLFKYNTNSFKGTVDNKAVLDLEDDVANVTLGGKWRMPTEKDWIELLDKCTWTWITQKGVNGRLVTGPNGKSIFLPAAGLRINSDYSDYGNRGYYWYSSIDIDVYSPFCAMNFLFNSDEVGVSSSSRYFGLPVRPVLSNENVPVASVLLDKRVLDFALGGTAPVTLEATVSPSYASNKELTWTSSNPSVATVDQTGKVTAVSNGTVTIQATANDGSGIFARCSVVVYSLDELQAVDMGTVVNGKNIKWASFNMGASTPEEFGLYYSWGEIEPKEVYSWATYKWGTDEPNFTKYKGTDDNKTVLDPEDDVAHVKLGGSWRMPTGEEWTALREQCTWSMTTQKGVPGQLVTAPNGNSIFLPAAGLLDAGKDRYIGSTGFYWSSSLSTNVAGNAYRVIFDSDGVRWYSTVNRYLGYSVRPVTE